MSLRPLTILLLVFIPVLDGFDAALADDAIKLDWQPLPDLPNDIGVAGPFIGVHDNVLIVAGGANFARPVWENNKQWHDEIHVLQQTSSGYEWTDGGKLPRPIAYGAAVSTEGGIVCMGGNDNDKTFDSVYALQWDSTARKVRYTTYPSLPRPCAYGQACLIGNVIYLAGGQSGGDLASAMNNFWSLDLSQKNSPDNFGWQELPAWSDQPIAFNIVAAQHNGDEECVYVISGRCERSGGVKFLTDVWEYTPRSQAWRERDALPRSMCAGTGIDFWQNGLLILGGDDGSLFDKTDQLKSDHPGFPREAFAYDTVNDIWSSLGATPSNQVTTTPVRWNNRIVIATGEVRPRKRTAAVWSIGIVDQ